MNFRVAGLGVASVWMNMGASRLLTREPDGRSRQLRIILVHTWPRPPQSQGMRVSCRGALASGLMPPRLVRGWRAERRKSCSSRSEDRAGASRRATRAQSICAQAEPVAHTDRACYLRRFSVAGPAFAAPCPASRRGPSRTGRTAFGIGRRVVSQLLAGPRSGPGGSPTPPRVPGLRQPNPRGHRTSSRLTTPHDAPFRRTRWDQDN